MAVIQICDLSQCLTGFSSMAAAKQDIHKAMLAQVFGFLQFVNLIHIEIDPIFGSRIDEVA